MTTDAISPSSAQAPPDTYGCPECGGSGWLRIWRLLTIMCPHCQGRGVVGVAR